MGDKYPDDFLLEWLPATATDEIVEPNYDSIETVSLAELISFK